MMKQPLVTVVIPVYNGEKYVKGCIENMLTQSYKNLEIIVVNDGSTDRSAEIAREYPVKIITLEKNSGLSVARNTGIEAATGEYIHFMDVDDSINTNYYQELANAVVETDADIACSGMVNEKRKYKSLVFKKRVVFSSTKGKLRATNVGKWGYAWRYLFRVDFLKKHNLLFEKGRLIEDMIFTLSSVFYSEKLVVVPGAEYTYFRRENSIMTIRDAAHREKRHKDWLHAKNFRTDFASKHNIKIPGVTTLPSRIAYLLKKTYKKYLT